MALSANSRGGSSGNNTEHQREALKAGYFDFSAQDGMTTLAGGAQAGTALSDYQINRFTTVTTGGDSAQLPLAKAGRLRIVVNAAAANSMNVFPQTGEFIDAGAANAARAVAAAKTCLFFCAIDGTWNSLLGA